MTKTPETFDTFFSRYDEAIFMRALKLRKLVLGCLPDITESIDLPAKMAAYSYGPKYADLVCVIIPSKKGLKLGFNRGTELSDPDALLEGTGKISRYVDIASDELIKAAGLKKLLTQALQLYQVQTKK